MAGIGLVSPGVKVREVDLTVGRIDSISDQTGAIVGPVSYTHLTLPTSHCV